MNKTICLLIFCLTLNCQRTIILSNFDKIINTEPVVVSAQVDVTIDPEERLHYDLYKPIIDFQSASFYQIPRGGYIAAIKRSDDTYYSLNCDPKAVDILRDYIDRYDEIVAAPKAFEKKWKIIDYDDLGQPITVHELEAIKGSWSAGYWSGALAGSCCAIIGLPISVYAVFLFGLDLGGKVYIVTEVICGLTGAYIGSRYDIKAIRKAIKKQRLLRRSE